MGDYAEPIEIELWYFDGCPSLYRVWHDLLDVIVEKKLDARVRPVRVETVEGVSGFAGSPTIRIGGIDLENYTGPAVMACRVYRENDGKGWPSKRLLTDRLSAIRDETA